MTGVQTCALPISSGFEPSVFVVSRVLKSLFFVVYAFLLGNALRDSKRPELVLVAFFLSAGALSLAVILVAGAGGVAVADRSKYLSELGSHTNTYAVLLGLAFGPLLFVTFGAGPWLARLASGVVLSLVTTGVLLTGSRGGALADRKNVV